MDKTAVRCARVASTIVSISFALVVFFACWPGDISRRLARVPEGRAIGMQKYVAALLGKGVLVQPPSTTFVHPDCLGTALERPWTQQTLDVAHRLLDALDAKPPADTENCSASADPRPASRDDSRKVRVAVLTVVFGTKRSDEMTAKVLESQRQYAERHGYTHIVDDFPEADQMGRGGRETRCRHNFVYWSKPFALMRHLASYDWVLWLDGDAMVNNETYPLEVVVGDGDVDLVSGGRQGWTNNGAFALRNSCWSRRFLRNWWEDGAAPLAPEPWYADNGAFTHAVFREVMRDAGVQYSDDCMPTWEVKDNENASDACYRRFLSKASSSSSSSCWHSPCKSAHLRLIDEPAFNKIPWKTTIKDSDFVVHFAGPTKAMLPKLLAKRAAAAEARTAAARVGGSVLGQVAARRGEEAPGLRGAVPQPAVASSYVRSRGQGNI